MTDPDVDLVVDFLNTVDHEARTDVLDDPVAWHTWLARRELVEGTGDARAVRDSLRTAVGDAATARAPTAPAATGSVATASAATVGDPATASAPAISATVRVELAGVPRLVATDVVGAVLAAASRLVVLDRWDRVKICPADDCRWAFYDRSRNHSRTWCSMQVCGNREKARTWRERHHAGA